MTLKYSNILVAVDGSKAAECAFKKALQISNRNQARLSLVHVIDTRAYVAIDAYNGTMANRAENYAEDLLSGYKEEAMKLGLENMDTIIEYGSPKTVIPKKVAKEIGADLIICGATGLNAVERLLIGSVSEHITRSATCDVLVVRSEEDEEEEV
ncbi:universal stress protein [Lederbergia galactosidilytica]|uniref:Universal stress protein n=1 Tax=Lederbergia galactosidilytica TaxID=217031 RepID=A0A177ZJQ3_9BACI|nr:universal stress protein [Lederbergia galactosidilytica]KRG14540.1 universal stress protein UspA [Virgibacillus soli]MBP1915386.1 nucleotide-binding universal stress UspA family protein [Lederbergia galactosidilytica]OAK68197.1 universal stress protein UspA [Lederbergia galactosidilytica]